MGTSKRSTKRERGEIETLPSGALRVRVYAGIDPVTGKRHYLTKTVPAGPKAEKEAEKVRTRFLNEVDERRNPRTSATVNQLLERYFELVQVEGTTMNGYESLARNHIRPLLGKERVGSLDGEVLDSFYKELRTCRAHCRGHKFIEHRTNKPDHVCDDRCKPHKCTPLGDSTIRKVHSILSGAGKRAVRWKWVGVNPFDQAEPQRAPRPAPSPPNTEQAAAISAAAWRDLDWGMLIWLVMVTGARRGEICALKWECADLSVGVLSITASIAQHGGQTWEKDTKTHQQRRITLDPQTIALLKSYRARCAERAGLDDVSDKARIFSSSPDGSSWLKPDSVSQRYVRMCKRLGWDMHIHQLRHYSATELISSGVDVTTVGGRLGHGGGGSTTLRFYSAWVAEADQRAAGNLANRMPAPPTVLNVQGEMTIVPTKEDEDKPAYKRIAANLRGAITCGAFNAGDKIPTVADLAERYGVAKNTAQRAVAALCAEGLVSVTRGSRAVVTDRSAASETLAKVVPLHP